MSNYLQFKMNKNNSNCKNKINMIKNMTGMNDPAFQSNNTLKKYIYKKLDSYFESKSNILTKTQSYSKINDKSKLKIIYNIKNIYNNQPISKHSKLFLDNICNFEQEFKSPLDPLPHKINVCNRNKKVKLIEQCKNNSFLIKNSYNNKTLKRPKNKRSENLIYLSKNNNSSIYKSNQINNSPINFKKNIHKTTPINNLIIRKTLFTPKQNSMNKNFVFENIKRKSVNHRNKKFSIQKINRNNTSNSPLFKKSLTQMKIIEFENKINNKTLNNNINFIDKFDLKEELKICIKNKIFNDENLLYNKNNNSINNALYNKGENDKKMSNHIVDLKDKANDIFNNEETSSEKECPVPMPYVKKYTNNSFLDCSENINLENIIINKDLKEPKKEEKIPIPISLPAKPTFYLLKNKKEKGILLYSKFNQIKIRNNQNKKY